jgi:hypothetical protein
MDKGFQLLWYICMGEVQRYDRLRGNSYLSRYRFSQTILPITVMLSAKAENNDPGRGDAGFLSLFLAGLFDTLEKSDLTLHRG